MFTRVLVANRGEIAVRVIRALHELGIEAVAIYSTADADALHVRLADRAVCIGPPPPAESYLNIPSVVAAAETTGCEAVHPGYGFLAERPEFVARLHGQRPRLRRPGAEVMARMGDKVQAKIAMREAGVPLVPGTEGATTLAQARELAPEIGFPAPAQGGGRRRGRGMRLVSSAEELDAAFATASAEADAAFGDGSLYVEKALVPARHVEIQVLADADGGVLTLGERECSIQRRHQKLIEESPSPALTPELREEMEAAAERACRETGYTNAGTLEFLLGPGPRLLLHRAERPAPGRAPRDRARHGHRHRPRAAADRGRRAADGHRPRSTLGPRDRDPDQRGGPGAGLRALTGPDRAPARSERSRASDWTRTSRRAARFRRSTTR